MNTQSEPFPEIIAFVKGEYNHTNKTYESKAILTNSFRHLKSIYITGDENKYTDHIIGEIRAVIAAILWAEKNNYKYITFILSTDKIEQWILKGPKKNINNQYDEIKTNLYLFLNKDRLISIDFNGRSYFGVISKQLFGFNYIENNWCQKEIANLKQNK